MPQEDGVVQRHSQLQHGGDGLGDVGNLTEEVVAAHVPHDAHANAQQEDERQEERVHRKHQHHAAQRHGDGHVDAFLLLDQLLGIRHDGGQSGHEALLAGDLPNLLNGFHGALSGGGLIEEHGHQPRVVLLEHLAQVIRQNLHREAALQDGGIADNGLHMGHIPHSLLQVSLRHFAQALRHAQGEGALAKILGQNVLALDRVQILRQIIQQVIFDLCGHHAEHRGDHQRQTDDHHNDTMLYQPPCEPVHNSSSFS